MSKRIGFIGCGNMGGALAKAASKSDVVKTEQLYLADMFRAQAEKLANDLEGAKVADNEQIARECQYIFLGVKPQMMEGMLESIAPILKERTDRFVLVSMAAGLSMSCIQEMAGAEYPIIRLMPNTPVFVGEGMVLYSSDRVTLEEKDWFIQMMVHAGKLDELPENLIDAGSAVSGCGPAFAYLFVEALADAGVACGLPRAKAQEYAAQMMLGSAKMVLETGRHPGDLKDAVCSPAGSTIEGVMQLENGAFRGTVMDAVVASYEKTKDLGKR